jgi:5-methylcytosine-specific restriction endonuclease McrA
MSTAKKRSGVLVLREPKKPNAPKGTCRWCGRKLSGPRIKIRRYCRKKYEGRDCVGEYERSRVYDPRVALRRVAQSEGKRLLRCANCNRICEELYPKAHYPKMVWCKWQADHKKPLFRGGKHAVTNLQCLCDDCHKTKTKLEAILKGKR